MSFATGTDAADADTIDVRVGGSPRAGSPQRSLPCVVLTAVPVQLVPSEDHNSTPSPVLSQGWRIGDQDLDQHQHLVDMAAGCDIHDLGTQYCYVLRTETGELGCVCVFWAALLFVSTGCVVFFVFSLRT